jgi:hypothetical protein
MPSGREQQASAEDDAGSCTGSESCDSDDAKLEEVRAGADVEAQR